MLSVSPAVRSRCEPSLFASHHPVAAAASSCGRSFQSEGTSRWPSCISQARSATGAPDTTASPASSFAMELDRAEPPVKRAKQPAPAIERQGTLGLKRRADSLDSDSELLAWSACPTSDASSVDWREKRFRPVSMPAPRWPRTAAGATQAVPSASAGVGLDTAMNAPTVNTLTEPPAIEELDDQCVELEAEPSLLSMLQHQTMDVLPRPVYESMYVQSSSHADFSCLSMSICMAHIACRRRFDYNSRCMCFAMCHAHFSCVGVWCSKQDMQLQQECYALVPYESRAAFLARAADYVNPGEARPSSMGDDNVDEENGEAILAADWSSRSSGSPTFEDAAVVEHIFADSCGSMEVDAET
ncbi:uncharacterized protein MONBRDRAFT_35898 [Monosiga brevicollis MX1]|uniref:Uncharacterized protein n=1 Tax=Monosiga brevicollis TaxID=81824 RepID=A9USG8_MONBE|nr:uncharacterized protein MONBRDRAFT_35898 [Monosiga brevicollis MX1]EDQ92098.1 predicted protein [Monosiga brevicollis MX1]|eukprot:XP_001743384.1 hypothetical protein [Monosiga brevicollis MX1]